LVNYPIVTWLERIEDIPLALSLIFANEFFDALPCKQIFFRQQQWFEKHVTWEGKGWGLCARPINNSAVFPENEDVVYEFSPAARAIAYAIANRLCQHGGTALIIDYGYEGPIGADTLQGMRTHRYHCPFTNLGEVDLSHQVDFTPLKEAFCASAVRTYPLETMGEFLARLGLAERTEMLAAQTTAIQRQLLLTAAVRLLNPAHMGHLFKVLIGEVIP
jgi:NADH dehydrogenase [ubiquinone] 1 alpha subcomplex assembly factor 7